jgi:Domain of unknown function (DUF4390)
LPYRSSGSVIIACICGCLLLVTSTVAHAAEFVIMKASSTLHDKVYYLNARIDYTLSDKVIDALQKGVPIQLKLEIEISRVRDYLWDETVIDLKQRYQLEYHSLTKQYIVQNINSGSVHNFPSLNVALSVLGTIVDLPIVDKNLLETGQQYNARLRTELDIDKLPVPLRLLAYLTSGWSLDSEWFLWSFQG